VATQTRRSIRALDAVKTNAPAACIPRAKFIGYLNDHIIVRLIRPSRQRSLDIEHTHPDAISKTETEPTRLRQQ
jgi:hypothetical protein